MIFVKSDLTSVIRNVEATTRKVRLMLGVLIHHTNPRLLPLDGDARDVWEQRSRRHPPPVS